MENETPEEPQEEKSNLAFYCLSPFIFVLIYIFSVFPVALLFKWSGGTLGGHLEKAIETIYTPLIWCIDNIDFFGNFMNAIAKLIGLH